MEKPYDLKALGEKIRDRAKEKGLELAEEAVETIALAAYHGTKEWLKESAALTPTPFDDLAIRALDMGDAFVEAQIAKVDLDGDGK